MFQKNYNNADSFKSWAEKKELNYNKTQAEQFKNFVSLQDFSEAEQDDKLAVALLKLVERGNNDVKYKKLKLDYTSGAYYARVGENNPLGATGVSMINEAYSGLIDACFVLDRQAQVCYVVYTDEDMNAYKQDVLGKLDTAISNANKTLAEAEAFELEKAAFKAREEAMKEAATEAAFNLAENEKIKNFVIEYIC